MRVVKTDTVREILGVNEQRAWTIGREPERFGLPRAAVIRIGRAMRWNLDLVEEWLARGGSAAVVSDSDADQREPA